MRALVLFIFEMVAVVLRRVVVNFKQIRPKDHKEDGLYKFVVSDEPNDSQGGVACEFMRFRFVNNTGISLMAFKSRGSDGCSLLRHSTSTRCALFSNLKLHLIPSLSNLSLSL
ncbi:hypothetical protein L6452_08748 [Arctium lappa]|uniref:Uncharacterized protein n=1 Tax=Arctium lappa TaxID=4217 RepID=A0ACB9DIS6_ARCLA|nr:hypothetical protein L6452_08748 [Arctium lappa]